MRSAARAGSSVGFFEQLYAIVVGLGLAVAIEQVLDLDRSGAPVIFENLPVFLAYLNIAFALAHASVRYLDLAYDRGGSTVLSKGRVVADLFLGVGQFLWLLALSFLITRPAAFAFVAIVLLVGRPLRDLVMTVTGNTPSAFDRKVAFMYLLTSGFLIGVLIASRMAGGETDVWILRLGTLGASLVFGLGLYLSAFEYFFANAEEV